MLTTMATLLAAILEHLPEFIKAITVDVAAGSKHYILMRSSLRSLWMMR